MIIFHPIVLVLTLTALASGAAVPRGKPGTTIVKPLARTLADEGITPRALLYIRDQTGTQKVQLREAAFTRIPPPPKDALARYKHGFADCPPSMWVEAGKELNVYQITATGVLDGRAVSESVIPLVRVTKAGPQMSLDRGKKWVGGEHDGSQWRFAFDAALYTLDQADETFTPASTKAWAIERGPTVRWPHTTYGQSTEDVPVMQSLVVLVEYGRKGTEIAGTLKFPGTDWVVQFRGVKWGDVWIALSTDPRPFTGSMALQPNDRIRTRGYFGEMKTAPLWMVIKPASILIGTSKGLDLAHMDRIVESFIGASEFELKGNGARELPALAEAYGAHRGANVWLRSDEPESFSWAADRAFVGAGFSLNLYPPTRNIAFNAAAEKSATAQVTQWSQRIQGLGGKVVMTAPPAW
jgi:hypothetical protein